MENGMLGEKKTVPLWRRRPSNLLAVERALSNDGHTLRDSDSEQAVMEQKAAQRRFDEAKGKIHPSN
jgi:hypothetical protein